jgi:TPR repeat protein
MLSFRTAALLALPLVAAMLPAADVHAAPVTAAAAPLDVKQGVDAWESGDYQNAVSIWRPLAVAGDPDAQFNLGQAYKLGRGVPADMAQAEGWYRRAAKQGHLQAEDNLGLVLFTANRRDEAMPFILRSADRGEPRAQYVLGTALFNGDLAARDWPRAYALTKRASDAGLDIASARLSQLDQLIPLEQRQRGLAMLPKLERSEQRARLTAVNAAAPAPAQPEASPIKVASLPPSAPGTSYTPPPVIAAVSTINPAPVKTPAPAAVIAAAAAAEATADAAAAVSAKPGTSYAAPPEAAKPVPVATTPSTPPVKVHKALPAPAKVQTAAASPWRAQLGAFAVEGNARGLWAALGKKYPAVAARQPVLLKTAKLTRLQAGDFANKGEADAFCASVRKDGQACLVVDK